MDTNLDAILGGSTTSVEQPAAQAATATETQTTTGGAEKPEQAGTPPAEKPKPEKSEADKAFATLRRELKTERQRREALEREVSQIRKPQAALDPIVDPEGFTRSFEQQLSQATISTRIAVMEELAAEKYKEDYEEMRDLFVEQAQDNPALRSEMVNARNPAEFAYKWAKEFKARSEIGDPIQYAEKIRQEAIAKTMADIDKIVEAKVKERLSGLLPSSLAETQTQGARVTNPDGFNGPTPLSQILKR